MQFKKLNSKGFTAIEAILVIAVLIAVGVVGYYVYHANKKASDTLSSSAKVAQSSPSKITKMKKSQSNGAQQTTLTETKPYLIIKEWGVEIPLSSGIKDAYYVYDSGYAKLGTRSLTAMSANCAPGETGISAISRQTASVRDVNIKMGDPAVYPVNDTKIGNYYYGISHAQASCANTINDAASTQQLADIKLFNAAFQSIRAVQ